MRNVLKQKKRLVVNPKLTSESQSTTTTNGGMSTVDLKGSWNALRWL
jgi:hypothetical protein